MSGDDCGYVSEPNCVRAHLVVIMYMILMVGVCIYIYVISILCKANYICSQWLYMGMVL